MLGSDGTVSTWDKDARTRMKSKPPSPFHRLFLSLAQFPARPTPTPHFGVCPCSFVRASLVIRYLSYHLPRVTRRLTMRLPYTCLPLIISVQPCAKSYSQRILQPHGNDIRLCGFVRLVEGTRGGRVLALEQGFVAWV